MNGRRGNSSNTRNTTQESPEESSWTMYLQDFLISSNHEDDHDDRSSFSSYDYESCSIISDAASSVARKSSTIKGEVLGFGADGGYIKSSFMIKRKPKEAVLDDALEDTASSPVNTPKVTILTPNCFCWSNFFFQLIMLFTSEMFNSCLPIYLLFLFRFV